MEFGDDLEKQMLELTEMILKQRNQESSDDEDEVTKEKGNGVACEYDIEDEDANADVVKDFGKDVDIDVSKYFETDKVFDSKEDLINFCKDVGKHIGVVVVIKKHEFPTNRRKTGRLLLACERGGKYRRNPNCKKLESTKSKHTGTLKCECPFELKTLFLDEGKYKVALKCGRHNHELADVLSGHPYAGRLTQSERDLVWSLFKNGVKAREILEELRSNNKSNVSSMRTIYNACNKFKKIERGNMSIMQYTLKVASEHRYHHFHTKDSATNKVTSVFWAHPESINILHCFPEVIILDCTYKTNRYRMPLLEIVSHTSTDSTFNVAFVFMEREKHEHYVWALECLRTLMDVEKLPRLVVTDNENELTSAVEKVFPKAERLLCQYHIECNLRKKCVKKFHDLEDWNLFKEDWANLVECRTEALFDDEFKTLTAKWLRYPACLSYIRKHLLPHKEYFTAAWTNKIMHFGSTTTNRVEGAHASLKRYLKTSEGSFPLVWNAMHRKVELQLNALDGKFQRSKIINLHKHNIDLFTELKGFVSCYILDEMMKELEDLKKTKKLDLKECGCAKKSAHGIPCAHELVDYRREKKPIPYDSIHPFWKKLSRKPEDSHKNCTLIHEEIQDLTNTFEKSSEAEKRVLKRRIQEILKPYLITLEEPSHHIHGRGRPRGSTNKRQKKTSSTKRDPSGFEIAEAQAKMLISQASQTHSRKGTGKKSTKANTRLLLTISEDIRHLVEKVHDVPGDGNCGFHAIALGLGMPLKTGWLDVRKALMDHGLFYKADYAKCWGEKSFDEVYDKLEFLLEDKNPPVEKWIDLPAHAHLAANAFERVIVLINPNRCGVMTIPPSLHPPDRHFAEKMIGIALTSQYHFGYFQFKKPLVAIPPLCAEWKQNHSLIADGWVDLLKPLCAEWEIYQPRQPAEFDLNLDP